MCVVWRGKNVGERGVARAPKRYRFPVRFYRANIYVIRWKLRGECVPCRLQIPLHHYAEIQWNPVSFRFIRGTLRTSLRSICLLGDCRFTLHGTDPLQVSWNVRQHVLDFPDNDTRSEQVSGIVNIPNRVLSFSSSDEWTLDQPPIIPLSLTGFRNFLRACRDENSCRSLLLADGGSVCPISYFYTKVIESVVEFRLSVNDQNLLIIQI